MGFSFAVDPEARIHALETLWAIANDADSARMTPMYRVWMAMAAMLLDIEAHAMHPPVKVMHVEPPAGIELNDKEMSAITRFWGWVERDEIQISFYPVGTVQDHVDLEHIGKSMHSLVERIRARREGREAVPPAAR